MARATLGDRLEHIDDAITETLNLWQGKTFTDYKRDRIGMAATERFLEKICEAAKHIPQAQKQLHPEIPWPKLQSLGNRLRHAYHATDPDIVWGIVQNHLDPLRIVVAAILAEFADDPA